MHFHQEKWPLHSHSGRQLSCNGGIHSNIWYIYDKLRSCHHLWYFDHCNILTLNYRPNHRHLIYSWTLFCPTQHKQYQSESWCEISSDIVVVSFSIAMNISPESFRCHRRWHHYDYSNVGLGSSLRGEPGLTAVRSQGCPWKIISGLRQSDTHRGGTRASSTWQKKPIKLL